MTDRKANVILVLMTIAFVMFCIGTRHSHSGPDFSGTTSNCCRP